MYEGLRPAMRISYDRVAMAGIKDKDFRVTFDTNIQWNKNDLDLRKDADGIPILKDGQYMMEIKVANAMPLELTRKLSELKIFPASFSKYGRGYLDMLQRNEQPQCIKEEKIVKKFIERKEKEVGAYA